MEIEISNEELEMLEVSVEIRLQTWCLTFEYLETGVADGLIAECHKPTEARWMVERYQALLEKLQALR